MHCDDVLKEIGEFGRYQRIKYFLLCFTGMTNAFQALVSMFNLYTPDHRCSLPVDIFNDTDTYLNQSLEHTALIDKYIPVTNDGLMDSCNIYDYSSSDGNRTLLACTEWVYDQTERVSTMVTKMNLVCDRKHLGTLATSMYMFGNLVGSLYSGIFADMFGRRCSLLVGAAGQTVFGIVMAFSPEFYSLAAFRFLTGVFGIQLFLAAFVIGMEMCGPSYRPLVGILVEFFWAIGFCTLVGLAYGIRTEIYLQLAVSVPAILYVSFYWVIPESPRWLLAKGRNEEAEKIFKNIAKSNGTTLPVSMELAIEEQKPQERLVKLFKAKTLLLRCIVVFLNWYVVAFGYYGLSFNSGNMPGSLYVNIAFSAVGEFVGYSLCFLCYILGRKMLHVGSMVIGGLACLASLPVYYFFNGDEDAKNWMFVVLNTIGKMGVTIGFAIIYFWCAEIFPTLLRTSLIGISSMCGRIGSILAPVVADIGKFVPPEYSQMVPSLIFGILTMAGGLSAIALPETTGQDLPETIAEANVFPQKLEELDTTQDKLNDSDQEEAIL